MTFSRRAEWSAGINRLTEIRRALETEGRDLLDLTVSNPTKAAIAYPLDELSDAMARGARAHYEPEPLGLPAARAAVAEVFGCHAADIVITASTSEAYSYLFKLLADPGDAILTATPSYPLLEHLAQLELVKLETFPLELHRRWEIETHRVREAIGERTRAIVVVNPNNPTGSYVTREEQQALASFGLPVISDEVFFEYALEAEGDRSSFVDTNALSFVLGGLSKSAGLPHYKLGWIRVSGPQKLRQEALEGLEWIADNYLSAATPVQTALPELIRIGARIRSSIVTRTRANLAVLIEEISAQRAATVLPAEGGWSAVIRVPRTLSDEDFAATLLRDEGVIVQPGYFFDFAAEGHVVVSLLTPPDVFREGVRRIARRTPS